MGLSIENNPSSKEIPVQSERYFLLFLNATLGATTEPYSDLENSVRL